MMQAVDAGADRLVHAPHTGSLAATGAAGRIKRAGIAVATTVSFSSEAFGEAIGVSRSAAADARHRQLLANIRHLWDEGVTVALGTDSPPGLDVMAELRALRAVLSPEEIVTSLTRNAAVFLRREGDLGTLEPGKIADIVMIDGDPLSRVEDLARVVMVVKDGAVVMDRR
jgi:imidazolonepropionase-like amidohydrolase